MALNWDKLSKLRRDFPTAKLAYPTVTRQLKKRPTDPYLTAWLIDTKTRMPELISSTTLESFDELFKRQPPITDLRLLSYLYELRIQWERTQDSDSPASAGQVVIDGWKNAAKALSNRDARLALLTAFFHSALKEGIWEDVRQALNLAQQEGLKLSKSVAFTLILANQLSAEKQALKATVDKTDEPRTVALCKRIALMKMQQYFKNIWDAPNDPLRVQTLGDIQFMATIYERQSRIDELLDLWSERPLPPTFGINNADYFFVKVDLLMKHNRYTQAKDECMASLSASIPSDHRTMTFSQSQALSERCHRLWGYIFAAVDGEIQDPNCNQQYESLHDLAERFLATLGQRRERTWMITSMGITLMYDRSVLDQCKTYWNSNNHRIKCYDDLRIFVERFSGQEAIEFRGYIKSRTDAIAENEDIGDKDVFERWLQSEVNVLKFDHLLTSSSSNEISQEYDKLTANVIRLCKTGSRSKKDAYYEAGRVAVHTLRARDEKATYSHSWTPRIKRVDRVVCNYQAALLSRHLTADEAGRQNRALVVLAIDQHVRLGLTSLAFSEYPHVIVKEILQDTLSHYLLTGISQMHPFDFHKVCPDKELQKVIQSIDKMESTLSDSLCKKVSEFQYDSAERTLSLRKAFTSSWTKHVCFMERRRIARLKGDLVTETMDPVLESFVDISDNRDYQATSILEASTPKLKLSQLPPPPSYASYNTVLDFYLIQDTVSQLVYKEPPTPTSKRREQLLTKHRSIYENWLKAEVRGQSSCGDLFFTLWLGLHNFLSPQTRGTTESASQQIEHLSDELTQVVWKLTKRVEESTDESTATQKETPCFQRANWAAPTNSLLPGHEEIKIWYGMLEILQVFWRLAATLDEGWTKGKVPVKERVRKEVTQKLRHQVQRLYKDMFTCVIDWIKFLGQHGETVLKEWARRGDIGQALSGFLSEHDVRRYSAEAVSSLCDTLSVVLQVKLERKS